MLPIPTPTFTEGLAILEVYDYFDRPVLFSCIDANHQIFLALWVAELSKGREEWLFTPITRKLFDFVRLGEIDLFYAFKQSSLNHISYIVTVDWDEGGASQEFRLVESHTLMDDVLPEIGERIHLDSPHPLINLDLSEVASEQKGIAQDLVLDPSNVGDHRAPAMLVGYTLQNYQRMLEALVHSGSNQEVSHIGRIPDEVIRSSRLDVIATYASSFAIRMVSTEHNMFSNQMMLGALDTLNNILELSGDPEGLGGLLPQLNRRFIARYNSFLRHLTTSDSGIRIYWSSSDGYEGKAALSRDTARSALATIDKLSTLLERQITLLGKLRHINLDTLRFAVEDVEDGTRFAGIFNESLFTKRFIMNEIYQVTLSESIEVNPITLEEKTNYRLIDISIP